MLWSFIIKIPRIDVKCERSCIVCMSASSLKKKEEMQCTNDIKKENTYGGPAVG